VIYLDSSALVKLALAEPESGALASYLGDRSDQALVSSSLHRAEVLRAIWRAEPGALPRAQRIIRRISLVSLSHELLDNAATVAPEGLPTTAAIHLASALAIKRDLTAFVCYDKQLSDAAEASGLPVASPA
jgi:predicted nucleic acid-binding protein